MPQRSESMASSTARGRQEEEGGVFQIFPRRRRDAAAATLPKLLLRQPNRTPPAHLSLCHIHTLTLISGCAPLLLSSEQGRSQILVQSWVSPPCNLQSPVHMCKCVVCKVFVCLCVCVWLQVVHVEASMVHSWMRGFHRGAADWRPLGVTRERACEDMRDVSWRPVRSDEEMLTGAPR